MRHWGATPVVIPPESALAALRAALHTWTNPQKGHTPDSLVFKQALIIRRDLKMQRGKEIAQGAHAAMAAVLPHLDDSRVQGWLQGSFGKIALTVDSEAEMMALYDKARDAGLIRSSIVDSGRTQFHGVPTRTTLAIGPDHTEIIDAITGSLKLR